MSSDLHPQEGARFLLERRDGFSDDAAVYSGTVFTPEQRFEYRVALERSGGFVVEPEGDGEPADPELEKRLSNFARQIARAAQGKLDDGLPPWPARVLRWRGPGRG
jgi:hypothetical protein